jgi:hypothetical protein
MGAAGGIGSAIGAGLTPIVRRLPAVVRFAAVVLALPAVVRFAAVFGLLTRAVVVDLVRDLAVVAGLAADLVPADRVPVVFLAAVVRAGAGFASDSVLAAVVSALAAEFIALVAVAIDRMAVDMVLADAVALVAAVVTLVAAEETLVAADDTLVAAAPGVAAVLLPVADDLRVPAAGVRLAVADPRPVPDRLAAGFRVPAFAVVRGAPDFMAADVLVVRVLLVVDLVRPVLAELRRTAAAVVAVFVGTDLFPP